jgi:hypothetical protein
MIRKGMLLSPALRIATFSFHVAGKIILVIGKRKQHTTNSTTGQREIYIMHSPISLVNHMLSPFAYVDYACFGCRPF